MGANAREAVIFLVTVLFNLYLGAVLLRIILQQVRADFFNPISQLVWKVTQPPIAPMQKLIPRYKRFDTAAAVFLFLLSLIYVHLVVWMRGLHIGMAESLIYAALKIIALLLSVYTLSLFAQAILSWVGPGINNPAANVLYSLNEPLLRPVRNVVPPIANLDLSPLVVILGLQFLNILLPLPGIFY